jgi:DNA polymerase
VSLKKVGAYNYAASSTTEFRVAAFAVDDKPVQLWLPGNPVPAEYFEARHNPAWQVDAHNDPFESIVEERILAPQFGFPLVPLERHRCTQAMALAAGLPAGLGNLADALELANRKDKNGERLMHQMSKPRKPRKGEDPNGIYWFEDDERMQRLYTYCRQDVEVLREAYYTLPQLTPSEQALWTLSCTINRRGFCVDRSFAEAARRIAQAAAPEIDAELAELTGGAVTGINQIARLRSWLTAQGCISKSLDKKALEKLLRDPDLLPASVQRVLELRAGGAQAATKKFDALLLRAGPDNRIRGTFKFHGAGTGRWSGEGFQAQNLKRPVTKDLAAAAAAISTGDYEHVKKLYQRPLAVVGDCSRMMVVAASGYRLIGSDFGAIESRVSAWVAGEVWKLDSYRRYDATQDPRDEPYCVTACKIFRVPDGTYTKESSQRSVGKVCDLAFTYQGSREAWRKFEPDRFSDPEIEQFKTEWRAAHPAIVNFWYAADRAAQQAVREPGRVVRCGPVAFRNNGAFLQLKLPSGRKISYPRPSISTNKYGSECVLFFDNAAGQFAPYHHGAGAFGGTWTENVVSGIARDLLTEAMLRVEAAGYRIVLHVHDELVCEVPQDFGSEEELVRLMTRKPAWALDLPIAASAWSGPRYMK